MVETRGGPLLHLSSARPTHSGRFIGVRKEITQPNDWATYAPQSLSMRQRAISM